MIGDLVATSYQPGVTATARRRCNVLTTRRISAGFTSTGRAPTKAAMSACSSGSAATL